MALLSTGCALGSSPDDTTYGVTLAVCAGTFAFLLATYLVKL